jgi:hypothetical protein
MTTEISLDDITRKFADLGKTQYQHKAAEDNLIS